MSYGNMRQYIEVAQYITSTSRKAKEENGKVPNAFMTGIASEKHQTGKKKGETTEAHAMFTVGGRPVKHPESVTPSPTNMVRMSKNGKNKGRNNIGAHYIHGGGTCNKTPCIGEGIASRQVSTANKSHKKEEKEQTEKGRKQRKIIWACE